MDPVWNSSVPEGIIRTRLFPGRGGTETIPLLIQEICQNIKPIDIKYLQVLARIGRTVYSDNFVHSATTVIVHCRTIPPPEGLREKPRRF